MSIQVTSTTDPSQNPTMGDLKDVKVEETKSAPESKESSEKATAEESDTSEEHDSKAGDDETEEKSDVDGKPKKKGGFKKRIDKLTTRLSAKEQEAEYWRNEALKFQKSGAVETKDTKPEVDKSAKPKPDDFDSHEAYFEAVADWKLDKRELKQKEAQARDENQKLVRSHVEKVRAFAAKHSDFDDLIEDIDDIPMSLTVQEVILASENGPELMYELAKNRKEYERICRLPAIAAARELGKFEARLAKETDESSEKETEKKISKAPAPIKPIGSKSSGSVKKDISDPNLSQAEYEQLRREQMKARGA